MIDKEKLKEIYREEFQHDPVFKLVVDSKLEGYLYPDSLLTMDLEKTYSTIEVGKMIGRKDSTIRNYFNTELVDYINPEKVGNLYRLNYMNILKIHMISLLYEKGGKNKSQIAYELGMKSGVKLGKENSSVAINSKELEMIKQHLLLEKLKSNLYLINNEKQMKINEKYEKQLEYNLLNVKKEKLIGIQRQRENEGRYIETITDALQAMAEQDQKNRVLLQATQKKGIFSRFIRKDTETVSDAKPILSTPDIERLKRETIETEKQRESRNSEIESIERECDSLKKAINNIDEEIHGIELTIQEQTNYIQQIESQLSDDNKKLIIGGFTNVLSKSEK